MKSISRFKKSILSLILITTFLSNSGVVCAQTPNDVRDAAGHWSEAEEQTIQYHTRSSEPQWILRSKKDVLARFESISGVVIEGSSSKKECSYSGTYAETPPNIDTVGWNGIAHTYCGTAEE